MLKKYGKSADDIANITKKYIRDNQTLLDDQNRINNIYRNRPLRKNCKVCNEELMGGGCSEFTSHDVGYVICNTCGHVNGRHDDDLEFSNLAYCNSEYAARYSSQEKKQYEERVQSIYVPKAEFLKEILQSEGVAGKILDIGAGTGYFCAASKRLGMDIRGVEITEEQVQYANKILGGNIIEHIKPNQLIEHIRNATCNVVSAIGVLEHIYNLRECLQAIKDNKNINYLYFSVPLFGFCVFLETVFLNAYNRQLGGPHTHLFTRESIAHMNDEFGFEIAGEWTFGNDVIDLYRSLKVGMKDQSCEYNDIFDSKFVSCIDEIQEVLDKHDLASEVHMVVRKVEV